MSVTVSFTDDADNAESLTSAATGAVAAAPVDNDAAGQPTISGTATTGNTLTAVTSAITDADGMDDAEFSYQWLRDNVAISGATGCNLHPGQRRREQYHHSTRLLHRRRR